MPTYNTRGRVQTTFTKPGLTRQEFERECDINAIMAKYQKTGLIDHIKTFGLEYGDYDAIDFQTAMDTILKGEQMFAELPSQARKYFDNSPQEFMAFVNDPANAGKLDEIAEELGLRAPSTAPTVEIAPETPSAPAEGENS